NEFLKKNSDIKKLDEDFSNEDYAFCVKKGRTDLLDKINASLEKLKKDGTLADIITNYIGTDEQKGKTPYKKKDVDRSNGTIVVATNAEFKPYEYYENGVVTGIDIDIMQAICDDLGMEMQIEDMQFDSIIVAVQSGKADVGAAGMTVTEDRKKNVDFSDSYTNAKQVILVRNTDNKGGGMGFIDKLKQSFVDDSRWQYILTGLKNTLIITIFAILIGLVLGSLIAIVRTIHDQNGKLKILNFICKIYLTIIRGTPAMIQLLIIYYVIFASVAIDKTIVAIVAFGLNSAAYVAEVVRSGINSVDHGQFEAGRSLGLNYKQTMWSIILPQAFRNMLPALCNEFISLLKETAISGYIGLNDLTKGGDIIRSQTFEAFIPLIAVALIYLAIVMLLTFAVNKLERKLKNNEIR
ncbi:MAG: ABC transporter substrate-binding protein/permease, partial [Acutalibacteraceae bacterium]